MLTVEVLERIPENIYKTILEFPDVTIYHTKEWHNLLQRAFGWDVKAIALFTNDKQLVWFLPFVNKAGPMFGKKNICLPLSHRVGPVCDPQYAKACFGHIGVLCNMKNVEIHEEVKIENFGHCYLCDITVLDLTKFQAVDDLYQSLDYKSVRYMIQKAQKNNVCVSKNLSSKVLDDYSGLQLVTRMRQGSPMYPRRFFHMMQSSFQETDHMSINLAYFKDKPVAGAVFFHFQERTLYAYSASVSDRDTTKLGINELVLWSGISEAFEKGMKAFDFGSSPVAHLGLRKYKEKWGGISNPQLYSYSDTASGPRIVNREGKNIKLASRLLRTMPKWAFERMSPFLLKWVI